MRQEVKDYIEEGNDLVEEPFQRLIVEKKLWSYKYNGFWAAMDTLKDKIVFDRMDGKGNRPWQVWES